MSARGTRIERGRKPVVGQAGASALVMSERVLARHRRRSLACRAFLALCALCLLSGVVLWRMRSPYAALAWLAAASVGLAALVWAPEKDPGRWSRGAEGEMATALLLEQLHGRRWAVFHDLALPGARANVDHLVIGPSGVWVVDSKQFRAPVAWRRSLVRGRSCLLVGGKPLSTDALCFEAQVVSHLLECPVRAVVAVHGKGLGRRRRSQGDVWVVAADRLVPQLRAGCWLRPLLRRRQVARLAEMVETRFTSALA